MGDMIEIGQEQIQVGNLWIGKFCGQFSDQLIESENGAVQNP